MSRHWALAGLSPNSPAQHRSELVSRLARVPASSPTSPDPTPAWRWRIAAFRPSGSAPVEATAYSLRRKYAKDSRGRCHTATQVRSTPARSQISALHASCLPKPHAAPPCQSVENPRASSLGLGCETKAKNVYNTCTRVRILSRCKISILNLTGPDIALSPFPPSPSSLRSECGYCMSEELARSLWALRTRHEGQALGAAYPL
ncbi:hypothetical protein C8Q74DRAFT_576738 [Fomes fomentarius]|nr:hypothetical protein C8Q74DRAFT_576738 [Fomes fomentarius]